jgi:hypothetical protein
MRRASILILASGVALACAAKRAETKAPEAAPTPNVEPAAPPGATGLDTTASDKKASDEQRVESGGGENKEPLAAPTKSEDDVSLTTLKDAEKALNDADQELQVSLVPPAKKAQPKGSSQQPPAGPVPTTGASQLSAGQPRCVDACKAFASLRRAAGAVCRLTSKDDPHCKKAEALVKQSEARVAVCKCGD